MVARLALDCAFAERVAELSDESVSTPVIKSARCKGSREMASPNDDPAIWVVRAGSGGAYAATFEELGYVALGSAPVCDVSGFERDGIREALARERPEDSSGRLNTAAGQLYRFVNEMRVGDYVVTPDQGTRELLIGKIAGEYEYFAEPVVSTFHHARRVEWMFRRSRDLLPQWVLYSLGSVLTVFAPRGRTHLLALIEDRPLAVAEETIDDGAGDEAVGDQADLFLDLQSRSDELIESRIAALDGYEAQNLVAGVLRGMGYYTQVAEPGPDGGVDVVAAKDPLAVEPPVLKVQVKARANSRSNASHLRELVGVLGHGEHGVFVSTGGFTRDARVEADSRRIALIDLERLRRLLVDYYDHLDQDTVSLVPLRRLYFP